MYRLNDDTIERIYAGWLGKVIGIRMGAPIEGWSSEQIQKEYGELWNYPLDYRDFAADDDSNGPIFLVRALEQLAEGRELCAQDVAEVLLNYAPFEHGFFWWGGYGVSTEHTAYLNLRYGIPAPSSGSIVRNGAVVAEQIGGQIFIDCWGLVSPGNPKQAAKLAEAAAGVTHGGNGMYGGIFVASCISLAFENYKMETLIRKALDYIPADCEYAHVVEAVIRFWKDDAEKNWRSCLCYIQENYGYDKYPGGCHIIPNAAVMILALLYGEDDFEKTLCICNMCGWDTDCNVGNIGTIMGVRLGLLGIDYDKWRKPINDLLICSGTMGSLNIMDIPYGASYMAKQAFLLAGEEIPSRWKNILENQLESCHFAYPGSTHAMRVKMEGAKLETTQDIQSYHIQNILEASCTGGRALRIQAEKLAEETKLYVYQKTYYQVEDLHDNRYEPAFSPKIYPGQWLRARVSVGMQGNTEEFSKNEAAYVQLYVRDMNDGEMLLGEKVLCKGGEWMKLEFAIPSKQGACLGEAGLLFTIKSVAEGEMPEAYLDYLEYGGAPDYGIDFGKERIEHWSSLQREITQFTRVKGKTWLEGEWMHISGTDFAETYTGSHIFRDYCFAADVRPVCGENHFLNVRVQGAMRSYAVGFGKEGKVALLKNKRGYHTLVEEDFEWKMGEVYRVAVQCKGALFKVSVNEKMILSYEDADCPYLTGAVGMSVFDGSHCAYRDIAVTKWEGSQK